MIRAGVSGTNWTGKTTTIEQFAASHSAQTVKEISLSPLVTRCPHPMVREQTPDASRWMLARVTELLDRPVSADYEWFDRTPLDILAFTQYAFDRTGSNPDAGLMSAIRQLVDSFHFLFFLRPSDEWPTGDSPTPDDVAFALLMDRYMYMAVRQHSVPVVELPWDLRDRQRIIAQRIDS